MQYPQDDHSLLTPWHLTNEQIQHFDQQGYIKLEQHIPNVLLSKLQHQADIIERQAAQWLHNKARKEDFFITTNLFTTHLNRLLHFHRYADKSILGLLGSPHILAPAQSLCSLDCVPTVDMMLFKQPMSDSAIPWHQDLIYPSTRYRVATFGIYLEDANAGDGALQIVPNSHLKEQDICHYIKHPPQNSVEITAKTGDVIIHNPMCVHKSDKATKDKRRTLYYEMRPLQALLNNDSWTRKLIHQRLTILSTAVVEFAKNCSELSNCQITLNHCTDWCCKPIDHHIDELYSTPVPFDTVNYCQSTTP